MDEVLGQLAELTEKFKRNNRLGTADEKNVREQLQMLLRNAEYVGQACKLIPSLPQESCCQAVLSTWKESDEDYREKLVRLLLKEPTLNGVPGWNRKLALVAEFILVDVRVALRLLIDLSGQLTRSGTKIPGRPFVSRFWKELMATRKLLHIPLGECDVTAEEISGIAAMVLMGLLESQEAGITLGSDYVNWLGRCRSKARLGSSLVKEVEKVIRTWPEDLQRRCLDLGLIKTVSYRIAPEATAAFVPRDAERQAPCTLAHEENGCSPITAVSPTEHGRGSAEGTKTEQLAAAPLAKLNIQMCLEWLTDYVKSLEKKNATLEKRLDDLKTRYEREKMRNTDQEKQIREAREELKRRQSLIDDLNEQLAARERENTELRNSWQEEKLAWKKEREQLIDRIDLESRYVLDEFKNRLSDRLSVHYRGCLEAKEKPPTSELAEYLKATVDRVFRELITQGIGLDGDK